MFKKLLSLVSVLPLIFFCATIHGQTQGEITGIVTDATGAVLPGATVTVTNTGTNATRSMKTNGTGAYDFPSLLPGPYSVSADAQGFEKAVQSGIELQVQQVIRSNFRMTVGQATETVAVSTAAPLVDTEDVTVGTVIGTQRIQDMPLNGRNFLQLVSLSPNVVYGFASSGQAATVEGGQRASTTISIAGQRAEYNYYTLDGLNDTDDNFNTYLLLPSVDALQEFKVQYGVYPAQYGRNTGQINVSSKSGTNVYHGALWEFNRNSVKDADNYDFTPNTVGTKSPLNRNQYGFTLAGPVRIPKLFNGKDRLFFMTNYEGQRFYTADNLTATLPPPDWTGQASGKSYADFSVASANPIYDPATTTGGPGTYSAAQFGSPYQLNGSGSKTCTIGTGTCNQIPASRLDKDAVYLLKYWLTPPSGATFAPGTPNYQSLASFSDNSDQFTVRMDLTESQKSTWFGRYSWSNELNVTPAPTIGSGSILTNNIHQSSIGNTRSITPSITNQFLFGYSGMTNGLLPNSAYDSSLNVVGSLPNGVPAGLATPTPIIYGIPGISMTNYTGFGAGNSGQIAISFDHIYQAVDNVSMIRGRHTIQFGVEFRRDQYNQEGNSYVTGSLNFTGAATSLPTSAGASTANTGNSVADFMLGITSSPAGAQLPLAVAQLRASDWYEYVQDTFKIRPNLTISYGIRYELNQPFWSKHDELFTTQVNDLPETEAQLLAWCPSLANPTAPAPCATPAGENNPVVVRQGTGNNFYAGIPWTYTNGVLTAQDGRLGKYLAKYPKKNFAPRLGIAWNPTDKWSVRTGYGLFYAEDIGNFIYDTTRNRAVRRNATGAFPYPNLTIENPFALSGGSGLTISNPTVLSEWPYRSTPYELQWELNVQRQLTPKAAIEVGYNGSEGHHLFRFINYNVPPPEAGNSQSHRPFPLLGPIQDIQDYVNATYNGAEVKYTQQMSHGVNGLIGYTWSRAIDNGSAIRSHGGDSDFPQNTYCKNGSVACGERGPSNFSQTHRIVSSLLYEPPIGRGKAFLNHGILAEVAGGWQFNEIFSIATGLPFSITETANQLNGGTGLSNGNGGRPSFATGQSPYNSQKGHPQWLNPNGFVTQPIYTWGNVARNEFYGPAQIQWDSSVMKMFPTWREQELQIRFEAFNAANHPNFGFPSSSFGSTSFGHITSLSSSAANRQLQLSAKYYF